MKARRGEGSLGKEGRKVGPVRLRKRNEAIRRAEARVRRG